MSPNLAALPTGALVALAVVAVAELALDVVALVVLVRTPRERLQLGARWPWVLMILLVNLVGAIVFLAAGRRPPTADESAAAAAAGAPSRAGGTVPAAGRPSRPDDPVQDAVDLLYPARPGPDGAKEPRP